MVVDIALLKQSMHTEHILQLSETYLTCLWKQVKPCNINIIHFNISIIYRVSRKSSRKRFLLISQKRVGILT